MDIDMSSYNTDEEPLEGTYEAHIGFSWSYRSTDEPQYITIGFRVTEEMEADLPSEEEYDQSVERAESQLEDWVANNLLTLLDMEFVEYVSGHDEITSVEELDAQLEDISLSIR